MIESINEPNDIKDIPENRLYGLANEIRHFLIRSISRTGGHLASNLGAVELTIALHRVYDLSKDIIIWDVGHQSYTHKILTGRRNEFDRLRKEGGISGFPRREESSCDHFDTGHSSTSLSAGVGYVKARELTGADYDVVAVIGDGALTGGMAYEALNNAALLETNFVMVLNDNEMSISRNIGGMADYLSDIRTSARYNNLKEGVSTALKNIPVMGEQMVDRIRRTKSSIKQLFIPGMWFENMGITYLGPIDGHDIRQMMKVFREARRMPGPVIVHVITEKGRGYAPALTSPDKYHGTSPFEVKSGKPLKQPVRTYTEIFSDTICSLARRNRKIAAVTAAMKEGTGLTAFSQKYPDRFFDVGIAEEHAVTFAAGLALGGLYPVVAIYSSFLQRSFDQLLMDICAQKIPALFAVDRAGFVGEDGKSHQGCFDLSYLGMMPGMIVMAPKNGKELRQMLKFAVSLRQPAAIRYPRGEACAGMEEYDQPLEIGKGEILLRGSRVALLAIGAMVETAMETANLLKQEGWTPTVVNMRFVKPLDEALICELAKEHALLVTMEENVRRGGFGEQVLDVVSRNALDTKVEIAAVEDAFVSHGTVAQQKKRMGLDALSLAERIRNLKRNERTTGCNDGQPQSG